MPDEPLPNPNLFEQPPEVLPVGDLSPDSPTKKSEVPSQRSPGRMMVEEALAMFAHGPMHDPLLEKVGPKQIDRTLEIQATREQNHYQLQIRRVHSNEILSNKILIFASFCLVCILFLVWLFLHYNKSDQVFNLIAILATGGGGVGIGVGLKGRANLVNSSPPSSSSEE